MSVTLFIPRRQIGPFNICERKPKPSGTPKYVVTKSGDVSVLKDFGRYSTAVRWAKAQLPREVPHVIVVMNGTEVETVHSSIPMDYTVIERIHEHAEGGHAHCDPDRVKEILLNTELQQA